MSATEDVISWNQLGCLSPHLIYVETGGSISPDQFAEKLAEELSRYEVAEPRGQVAVEVAATISSRRDFYRVRASGSMPMQVTADRFTNEFAPAPSPDGKKPRSITWPDCSPPSAQPFSSNASST